MKKKILILFALFTLLFSILLLINYGIKKGQERVLYCARIGLLNQLKNANSLYKNDLAKAKIFIKKIN